MIIEKKRLQLVGVACMKIADVFNERSKEYYRQENAIEYAYITADEYSPKEVIEMEKDILNILKFKLYAPTPVHFIALYNRIINFESDVKLTAEYLADLMMLTIKSSSYAPSLLASACLFVAMNSLHKELPGVDSDEMRLCRSLFSDWATVP